MGRNVWVEVRPFTAGGEPIGPPLKSGEVTDIDKRFSAFMEARFGDRSFEHATVTYLETLEEDDEPGDIEVPVWEFDVRVSSWGSALKEQGHTFEEVYSSIFSFILEEFAPLEKWLEFGSLKCEVYFG